MEAIEQAAGEAAKAAVLSMVEREAEALQAEIVMKREMERWRLEVETLLQELTVAKRAGRKNTVIGVMIGILGGLVLGISGSFFIGGR